MLAVILLNDWVLCQARLKSKGNTARERILNTTRESIFKQSEDLLANKVVKCRGQEINIVINSTDIMTVKKFNLLCDFSIDYGDYIVWNDKIWIVTSCDYDDELYVTGKITQCNYELKWQNKIGETISRWCIVNVVSKYNNGVFEGKVIDVLESTLMVIMPFDSETLPLKREKRFIVDFMQDEPYVYVVTQRDVATQHYGNKGLINLALSQTTFNEATDNVIEMIADYNEAIIIGSEIIGSDIIRLGQRSTYQTSGSSYSWTIRADDANTNIDHVVEITDSYDNKVILQAKSNSANINQKIILSDGVSEFIITVKGLF